jgi:AcrR family transcriptional regulator
VPTRQRLTREEKKAQTRERLIEAAAKVFAEKGFAATSLDEVAEEAGLTKGAVYSNFDSKEDLVRAVLELNQRRMHNISEATGDGTVEQQAAEAARLFGEVVAQERAAFLLFLEFTAYALRNPDLYPDFLARHRAGREDVARMVEQHGVTQGAKAWTDPKEKALIFDVIGSGIALEKLIDPEGVPDDLFARLLPVLVEAFDAGRL